MSATARQVIEKLAELDSEMGGRPETRAEAQETLATWQREAKSAVRAGVKRGSPSIYLDVDDWFTAIVDAFETLGMKTASQVYLNAIFGRAGAAAHATKRKSSVQLDREIARTLAQRTRAQRGHATMIGKVILANRIKTSASLGEPRHYATLVDQTTGRTIYKSAVKQTSGEAAALAETFAKRRHLDIVGRV
jgi:hypothetical protein